MTGGRAGAQTHAPNIATLCTGNLVKKSHYKCVFIGPGPCFHLVLRSAVHSLLYVDVDTMFRWTATSDNVIALRSRRNITGRSQTHSKTDDEESPAAHRCVSDI